MNNRDAFIDQPVSKRDVFTALTRAGTNTLVLQFQTVSNRTYTVQFNSEATGSPWTNLVHFDARTTNGIEWLTNSLPQNAPRGFYRVVTPRQP